MIWLLTGKRMMSESQLGHFDRSRRFFDGKIRTRGCGVGPLTSLPDSILIHAELVRIFHLDQSVEHMTCCTLKLNQRILAPVNFGINIILISMVTLFMFKCSFSCDYIFSFSVKGCAVDEAMVKHLASSGCWISGHSNIRVMIWSLIT